MAWNINVDWSTTKPTEMLWEYLQKFSDLLLKSSGLLLHQAKDLAYITHFICNLHNLQLCVRYKPNLSSEHHLAQKKDSELCIIEGLYNHDPEHKINNISNKQYQNSNTGPFHGYNSSHLKKDCEDLVCKRCKPNSDNHSPARSPRKRPPNRQQQFNPSYNNNPIWNKPKGNNDPNLQLSISTSKSDHIAELLEATKRMTRYFKKSYKHNKSHNTSNDNHYPSTNHNSSLH